MTQNCELDQDFRASGADPADHRSLPSIVFCEAIESDTLRGRYGMNSDLWRRVRRNDHERYHVLRSVPAAADAAGAGMPELGLDFNRYCTLPTAEVYRRITLGSAVRRGYLLPPYRDDLSRRFFGFQMRVARVALPEELPPAL